MYAKNFPTPRKLNFPYQEQQRYSGSLVISEAKPRGTELTEEMLRAITESAKKLEAAQS